MREEQILVLQGGGALGAYQAGAFEALTLSGHVPDWIAGISIGAINAALIAGNAPEHRVDRLREFWTRITTGTTIETALLPQSGPVRAWANDLSAAGAMMFGQPGFFRPAWPPPWAVASLPPQSLGFYDTKPLRDTLEALVDFDRINDGPIRLSIGAVNVRTGNFAYFDSRRTRLDVRHILASGALPPGFPPVEIDGEFYWDGGLVSNTPLEYVLDQQARGPRVLFQVDLFPAQGPMPASIAEVLEREKDIRYSSRTRLGTDAWVARQRYAKALRSLLERLPDGVIESGELRLLADAASNHPVTILHLIHRHASHESHAKDTEFSRASMLDHWAYGRADVERSFAHPRWTARDPSTPGVQVFDLTTGGHGRAA